MVKHDMSRSVNMGTCQRRNVMITKFSQNMMFGTCIDICVEFCRLLLVVVVVVVVFVLVFPKTVVSNIF